jgi:Na+-transporting methylmalonyl-CoA/oxaloacetate decarboxylase gamma subunit
MRWNNQISMVWITIPFLLATLAWTALSFFAYSDWVFAFRISLPVWLVCAAVWAITRFSSAALHKRSSAPEKANIAHRNRLSIASVAVAVFLAILVLAVWGVKWLERGNESGRKSGPVARNTADGRVLGKETQRLQTEEEPKRSRSTETIPQHTKERWSVQVGAFRSEQDAVKVATTLKGKGYEAYVIRGADNAVNLYQAKVGRFTTREEAERLLRVLKDKEAFSTAFVGRL